MALHVFLGNGPLTDGLGCLMEVRRRPSRHPLHGRNDMKTSKKRFSRQKHAHKQRKKVFHVIMHRRCTSGRSSLSSLPKAVRFHECGAPRHGQAPSGAVRYSLKRSASILVQPSSSAHHYRNTGEALPLEYLGSNKTGILLLCLISNGESVCT